MTSPPDTPPDNSLYKARPLHRQRGRRRSGRQVQVLNQTELIALLGIGADGLGVRLDALQWPYHCDAAGNYWVTLETDVLQRFLSAQ